MHRNFVVSGDIGELELLAHQLAPLAEIITLQLDHGGSLKPGGGVLSIQALNRSADAVLLHLDGAAKSGKIIVAVGASSAIVDRERQQLIHEDVDEMLWEEMEQNMRNEGRLSSNQLALMALGGVCAAAALTAQPVMQISGLIAASIIAPALPPIAAVPLGIVLRQWHVLARSAVAFGSGYAVLLVASAATFAIMRAMGAVEAASLHNSGVLSVLGLQATSWVMSGACAISGALIIASLRDLYVIGPLIGLVMVPVTATLGAAVASGEWDLAGAALERLVVDISMVIVGAFVIFLVKQRTVHRRRPLS